jgi:hypothetical protein
MKKTVLTLFLSAITIASFSQEITVAEPDFDGQIFYVDNNEPVDLEETVYYSKKGKSVGRMISGVGKVKARLVVDGKTSPVKITKKEKIYFVVNYDSSNRTLPSKVIECLKFEQGKKTREYLVASVSNVSGQNTSAQLKFEKFKGKKYGEYSYLVEFTNLEVGEYGFSIGGKNSGKQLYMFTIVE